MQEDVLNDSGFDSSDPQQSVLTISDDNAGFTINVEDADADAGDRRAMHLPYGNEDTIFADDNDGTSALYDFSHHEWGGFTVYASDSSVYPSDNSSVYHSPAFSDADSFEELKPPSLTSSPRLADSVNTWRLTNESIEPQMQPSEPYAEHDLSNALGGVSLPHSYQQGPSETLNAYHHHPQHIPHLYSHPTHPSHRSHLHYDHADLDINQRPTFEPPSPTGSWSSQSSDYHTTSVTQDYLNLLALPVSAPSPTGSESGASDVSSAGSTRSSRGRDQAAITKRRKQPANHRCEICDKADFTTIARLKSHQASKHEGQTYQCSYAGCEKVYHHSTSRDRHFKRDHRSDAASGSKQPDQLARTYGPYSPY